MKCENQLLRSLPPDVLTRLTPDLELLHMPMNMILCESGERLTYAYFPTTAVLSLVHLLADGHSAETAVVGNEGMLGLPLIMGGEATTGQTVVKGEGYGYRISSRKLRTEFDRIGALMRVLMRYTQALITQMSLTAVCNRHHTIEQQFCRCLLHVHDRLNGDDMSMTQELIANMLGVRREGVTDAAVKLRKAGVIDYRRGHIRILDRRSLENAVCECYAVVVNEYDRLLERTGGNSKGLTSMLRPSATRIEARPMTEISVVECVQGNRA